jgi:hypothetical protein
MNEGELKKYLPLGTVVLLKNASKKVMVTGYMVKSPDSGDKVWDYMGCLWPEGVISSDKNLLFNHENVDKVFFLGYETEEQKKFIEMLNNTNAA